MYKLRPTYVRATDTADGKRTLFSRDATTKAVVLISGFLEMNKAAG